MSKRKISQQQQRRIANNREQLPNDLGHAGLVIADHGQTLEIENDKAQMVACNKRQHLGPIVPGDQVIWQASSEPGSGVVVNVLPRKSLLSRPDSRGKLHAVAANVDQIFVTIAPVPAPQLTTIDRYLVAAQLQGINAILVLNKSDLIKENELLQQYTKLGYNTLELSAKQKHNFQTLEELLRDKVSVFVGQSGVGKSSIIAALLPQYTIKTGAISDNIKQGKHTTTNARLYHLDNQAGAIIDSPGIREFPLWPLTAEELARGFIEFAPYSAECKFRNCAHTNEPGCGLLAAVNAGKIAASRLASYQKILSAMRGLDCAP